MLLVKGHLDHHPENAFTALLGVPLSLYAMVSVFSQISGGMYNPSLVAGGIAWQCLTWMYDPRMHWSMWTTEYAAIYIVGPLLGGFMAGHLFNQIRYITTRMAKEDADLTTDSDAEGEAREAPPGFYEDVMRGQEDDSDTKEIELA